MQLKNILFCFVISVTIMAVYCISHAFVIYHATGTTQQFFYHPLVKGLNANAVYYGLYTVFSISALLFFSWENTFPSVIKALLLAIQVIFFILLSSRTLIILFFLVILPVYLRLLFLQKKPRNLLYTAVLLVFFLIFAFAIFKTNNPIERRYTDILDHTEQVSWSDYKISQSQDNNLSLRLFLWRVGIDNIKEHDLWWKGAGNGSIYALQNKKMADYGVMNMYDEKNRSPLYDVNLHNMYLQTLMMLGVGGLVVFLLIALLPFFYTGQSDSKTIIFIFNFIMVILMIQESSLQTQAGIVFYTFFSMIFYNYTRPKPLTTDL